MATYCLYTMNALKSSLSDPNNGPAGSSLTLEVIKGPSQGLSHSVLSPASSNQLLTLGRVPQSDVLLKDPEVWNVDVRFCCLI